MQEYPGSVRHPIKKFQKLGKPKQTSPSFPYFNCYTLLRNHASGCSTMAQVVATHAKAN